MKSSTLKVQRVLVLLGFLLIAGGQLPALGNRAFPSQHNWDFYWTVSAAGYVVFGLASLAWLAAMARPGEVAVGMRWVLRLVALACLLLGVAYSGLINDVIELHRQPQHVGLRRQLLWYGLPLVGFCVAALGFWTAAPKKIASPSVGEAKAVESAGL